MIDTVDLLYCARYPLIWIETFEETRALDDIRTLGAKLNTTIYTWTVTKGLLKDGGGVISDTTSPARALEEIGKFNDTTLRLVVLFDMHMHIEDAVVIRALRDLAITLPKNTRTSIILISPKVNIPQDLQKTISVVSMQLPSREILEAILTDTITKLEVRAEKDVTVLSLLGTIKPQLEGNRAAIISAGLGLTATEFSYATMKAILQKSITPQILMEEKQQIIKKTGILEYYPTTTGVDDIGGLSTLKAWMKLAKKTFDPSAAVYGIRPLRGVLLIGPPGTGKSLAAKVIAHEFGLPLLRLDMSSIASKYYGESSLNIKHALDLADVLAPDVFMWDEVEKMFATGGSGEGHEETMRVLSVLLTHAEESTQPVFRCATCNNPFSLKPEMIQRFPKVFFVDLPTKDERKEIFTIHIKAVGRDPDKFDIGKLARSTDGFVGREIRNVIQEAMLVSFYESRELTTDDIVGQINLVTPLAKQDKVKDGIDKLREWAKMNAVNASGPEITDTSAVGPIV